MKISVSNPKTPVNITSVWAGEYKKKWRVKSGSIVTFSDAWVGSKIYPNANIVPVQSLNGYDKPYPPGGWKNKYSGGDISLGGSNARTQSINIDTIPAGSYYLSATWGGTSSSGYGLEFYDANNTRLVNKWNNGTLTLTGDAVRVYAYMSQTDYSDGKTVTISDIQVELGSSATSYSPYSNICPITGHSSADVSRCGKNLFDPNSMGHEWVTNQNAIVTYNVTKSFRIWASAGDKYTLSNDTESSGTNILLLAYCDESGNVLSRSIVANGAKSITATAPANTKFLIASFYQWAQVVNAQLELGSEPTDYVPYNGITKTISLGSTIYGGTLNVDSGVLTVDRAIVTYNGSESWSLQSINSYGIANIGRGLSNYETGIVTGGITNRFAPQTTVISQTQTEGFYIASSGYLYLRVSSARASTEDELKTWLASNNVTLVYKCTPTTVQLTGEEITALLGENNVWASSGDVEVTYRKGGA